MIFDGSTAHQLWRGTSIDPEAVPSDPKVARWYYKLFDLFQTDEATMVCVEQLFYVGSAKQAHRLAFITAARLGDGWLRM